MMRSALPAPYANLNTPPSNGTRRLPGVSPMQAHNRNPAMRPLGLDAIPSSLTQALDAFTFQLNPETQKVERRWLSLLSTGALEALPPRLLVQRYTEWKSHQNAQDVEDIQPFAQHLNRLAFQYRHLKGAERIGALAAALQETLP